MQPRRLRLHPKIVGKETPLGLARRNLNEVKRT
jgi:hypothetical protein